MFGQSFQPRDLLIVLLLVVLEGVLSIDNALVLGLLARRLPRPLQRKALTYGLIGAFVFRFIAIAVAAKLLEWRFVKLLGGAYLIYVAVKHLFFEGPPEHEKVVVGADGLPVAVDEETGRPLTDEEIGPVILRETHGAGNVVDYDEDDVISAHTRRFWSAVLMIELTDIAFAVDSILAAIALVGSPPADHPAGLFHPKLWVVVTGGMLGVILMRFAAVVFIKLLEKFPRFELSAYLLVLVIGLKLIADWWFNAYTMQLNFHSPSSLAFWVFWVLMLVCFCVGFLPRRRVSS
jgi:YkoY family integral membrane protein